MRQCLGSNKSPARLMAGSKVPGKNKSPSYHSIKYSKSPDDIMVEYLAMNLHVKSP